MNHPGGRWRAQGGDIDVLSSLLHDGSFALAAGSHDSESGEFVLPMRRLEHATPDRKRYLVVTVQEFSYRRCTLRISYVVSMSVSWDEAQDADAIGLDGEQSFHEIIRTDDGLVLSGLLGSIELRCSSAPVVEVEDGELTNEVGMTQLGSTSYWESLSAELERLRVDD